MGVEVRWLGVCAPAEPDPRPACVYCRRRLTLHPVTPTEKEPHCGAARCRWCDECGAGETLVSPLHDLLDADLAVMWRTGIER